MTRQQIHQLVDQLPETALPRFSEFLEEFMDEGAVDDPLWQDPEFQAFVLDRIRQSEEAEARGELVSMEDAKKRFAKWLKP